MTWPEAFAVVGGGACGVVFFWVLLRAAVQSDSSSGPPRRVSRRDPMLWNSSKTTILQPATGKNADGEDTCFGYTLDQIAADPDGYVAAVRKFDPNARVKSD